MKKTRTQWTQATPEMFLKAIDNVDTLKTMGKPCNVASIISVVEVYIGAISQQWNKLM